MLPAEGDQFRRYVNRLCEGLWSKVTAVTTEHYQGRLHYKVASQMLWYKTRCYVKLPFVALPTEEFAYSQFFASYPLRCDEQEEISGTTVLSLYVLIEEENHLSQEACLTKRLSYRPEDIIRELQASDPVLFRFVSISYDNFEFQMRDWPRNQTLPVSMTEVLAVAEREGLDVGKLRLSEYRSQPATKVINQQGLRSLLQKRGRVDKYVAHSNRIVLEWRGTAMAMECLLVYYLKERY